MPFVAQVAVGRREKLAGLRRRTIRPPTAPGYATTSTSADLAQAHLSAVAWVASAPRGCEAFNLGTGRGRSVLELVEAFSRACGRRVPTEIAPRRPGDVAICHADPGKAERILGWRARLSLQDMCESTWRWQSRNPNGYQPSDLARAPTARAV